MIPAILIIIHVLLSGQNTVSTDFDPSWSVYFGVYELIFSQGFLAGIFITSLSFYRDLSKDIKKKFRWYLIGLIFLDLTLLNIVIDNMDLIAGYGTYGAFLNFAVVIGAILIYNGIVRRPKS